MLFDAETSVHLITWWFCWSRSIYLNYLYKNTVAWFLVFWLNTKFSMLKKKKNGQESIKIIRKLNKYKHCCAFELTHCHSSMSLHAFNFLKYVTNLFSTSNHNKKYKSFNRRNQVQHFFVSELLIWHLPYYTFLPAYMFCLTSFHHFSTLCAIPWAVYNLLLIVYVISLVCLKVALCILSPLIPVWHCSALLALVQIDCEES